MRVLREVRRNKRDREGKTKFVKNLVTAENNGRFFLSSHRMNEDLYKNEESKMISAKIRKIIVMFFGYILRMDPIGYKGKRT